MLVFFLCKCFVTFVVVVPSFSLQEVRHEFFSFPLNFSVIEFIFLLSSCLCIQGIHGTFDKVF